ncbi:MAG: class I SAM-dependent methyltransferase [Acidobacteria bacterium]|nr:class I SAM-dependent methyltransferase [Acidobacteriota bacterium]
MSNPSTRMRDDWNARAREDAHYYVAFGRRNQSAEEFFATAADQVRGLTEELKRLPPATAQARRAVEIGCGPGRLMHPMSRYFGEIHGVDISDEMVRLARENLAAVPHAHPHHAPESDLRMLADSSFDFAYSYAVFQHIPSEEVVLGYLREAWRVLKPQGILRCQLNGLPATAKSYDTWSGVRISAERIREFAREQGFKLLALEGIGTQYMWTTLSKGPDWSAARVAQAGIRRVTNARNSEPAAPVAGPYASVSLWIDGLPEGADLNSIEVLVAGSAAVPCYLGPAAGDGMRQLNAYLPAGLATGVSRIEVLESGRELCAPAWIRLIRPGPAVPRLTSLGDGIDLLSGTRIVTRTLKAAVEEVRHPESLTARVNGIPAKDPDLFRTDPRLPRHELNFTLPDSVGAGPAMVEIAEGSRVIGRVQVEVAV